MYKILSLYHYLLILANCRDNSHVHNLIGSHSNSVVGWTLNNIGSGQFNTEASHSTVGCSSTVEGTKPQNDFLVSIKVPNTMKYEITK